MSLRVVVPPHPLIGHWLTMLRISTTPAPLYATGLEELGRWLTYEAIRDWLPYKMEQVETIHGSTESQIIESTIPLLAIPLMPGGFEMWLGARKVLPTSSLCLSGVPKPIEKKAGVIVFVDQISNGETLLKSLSVLRNENVETQRLRVITALASNPGLKRIGEEIPDLTIYTANIDPEITDYGELIPGIGNPCSRLNTRTAGPN